MTRRRDFRRRWISHIGGSRRRTARVMIHRCQFTIDTGLSLPTKLYGSPVVASQISADCTLRGWLVDEDLRDSLTVELLIEGTEDSDPYDAPTWVEIDRAPSFHHGHLEVLEVDQDANLLEYQWYRYGVELSVNSLPDAQQYSIDIWSSYYAAARLAEVNNSAPIDLDYSDIRKDLTEI